MNLRVIKAGVLDTVQDLGRYEWQQLGINPGGAMDRWSAQVANILVNNKKEEAILELHFPASEFIFEEPALITICGANFSPNINGEEIPCSQPVLINKYSILQFHGLRKGARAYLAVHGGFDIPVWLNSYSTNLKAGAGGYNGRALQKDDEIALRSLTAEFHSLLGKKEFIILPWKADTTWDENETKAISILEGNEWDRLQGASKENIQNQVFAITHQSDRMGYQLQGDTLSVITNEELISSAVSFGTIQLLPDGQLIVLMADHQTTGGYPRVAHVISAHHSRLAQMKTGDKIRFRVTDLQTAEELLVKQQQHLLQLQNACTFRLQEYFKK
ncbi:MAG TPA: biotin-dependent carboxyltransferase family protein [Chitinophagaceae bacterium]|nr:biotin-dependent carboxyltransferase family protein [Chitinophagaceae bacterium]